MIVVFPLYPVSYTHLILEGDFALMGEGRLELTYLPENSELIGSATKVDCGRRLQQFDLRYRGPVPASCPECGGTLHSHGARTCLLYTSS